MAEARKRLRLTAGNPAAKSVQDQVKYDKTIMSWAEYQQSVFTLAQKIAGRYLRDIKCITGLPRGGLMVGVSLSHLLDIPFVLPKLVPMAIKKTQLILIADDIIDSGETMLRAYASMEAQGVGPEHLICCCLHYLRGAKKRPEIYGRVKGKHEWIVYPWERYEAATERDGTV